MQNISRWDFHDKKEEYSGAEAVEPLVLGSGLSHFYQGCLGVGGTGMGFRMATGLTERMMLRAPEKDIYEGHVVGWST